MTMTRIAGLAPEAATGEVAQLFAAQIERYGRVLPPSALQARIPVVYRAIRGMWAALDESGLLPKTLVRLVNRRVAGHNGCPF